MIARVGRLLFPFALVVAAALWAKGYVEVGGGFAAGAVAGLGAVGQAVCLGRDAALRIAGGRYAERVVAVALVLLLALVLGPGLAGLPPVTHLPEPGAEVASVGVLELHTTAAFDLAVGVLVYAAIVAAFLRVLPDLEDEKPWIS